jgi:hypothetical protein
MTAEADLGSFDATLQHIELLSARRERLTKAQIEAEEQLVHRIGRAHASGRLAIYDLVELLMRFRDHACPGFSTRWKDAVGIRTQLLHGYALFSPNGPNRTWHGSSPPGPRETAPPKGQAVVYVLFDAANEPCYVGSSSNFRARVKQHRRAGKVFVRWCAYLCPDREAAFRLEDKLLREHSLYLNVKRSEGRRSA